MATSPFGRKMSRVEALEAGGSKVDPLEGLDYALDNPNVRCDQQSNLIYRTSKQYSICSTFHLITPTTSGFY